VEWGVGYGHRERKKRMVYEKDACEKNQSAPSAESRRESYVLRILSIQVTNASPFFYFHRSKRKNK